MTVVMKNGSSLQYLPTDQLGSTSLTTDANGVKVAELRYKAFGEVRYSSGTMPSGYTYTGQYSSVSDFGLMYFGARWYDPALGRFAQADSVVPGGVQGLDRYAYARGNPLRYIDPTGHTPAGPRPPCEDSMPGCGYAKGSSGTGSDVPPLVSGQNDPTRLLPAGRSMYNAYARIAGLCGQSQYWWHLDCSQPFTATDFMILVLSGELSPFYDEQAQTLLASPSDTAKLKTAAANWFSDSCLGHVQYGNACVGPTENAILNWMGENLESGMRLFNNDPTTQYNPAVTNLARDVLTSVLSVPSQPSSTDASAPVHWGNASYYSAHYGAVPSGEYRVLGGDNPFYVIPYNEEYRMCHYSYPCPSR